MIDTLLSLEHPFDVLVVDDGSPDGTAALVKGMMNVHPDRHNKHFQFQQEEDAAGVAASSAFYYKKFDDRY